MVELVVAQHDRVPRLIEKVEDRAQGGLRRGHEAFVAQLVVAPGGGARAEALGGGDDALPLPPGVFDRPRVAPAVQAGSHHVVAVAYDVEHLAVGKERVDKIEVQGVGGRLLGPSLLTATPRVVFLKGAKEIRDVLVPVVFPEAEAAEALPVVVDDLLEVGQELRLRAAGDVRMRVQKQAQQRGAGARVADDEDGRAHRGSGGVERSAGGEKVGTRRGPSPYRAGRTSGPRRA
jgi:hypothetical protein